MNKSSYLGYVILKINFSINGGMKAMELKKVLNGIEGLKAKGDLEIDVANIECDSKKITNGDMFVAIKGYDYDGHEFVEEAIENGAKVVVVQEGTKLSKSKISDDITIIMSENTRELLAKAACNFYKNPSRNFKLIGITGTKGKTTTRFYAKSNIRKMWSKGWNDWNHCKLYRRRKNIR